MDERPGLPRPQELSAKQRRAGYSILTENAWEGFAHRDPKIPRTAAQRDVCVEMFSSDYYIGTHLPMEEDILFFKWVAWCARHVHGRACCTG